MSFTESIKTCFQKYAFFEGRASRSEFWYWQLFCFLVQQAIYFVAATEEIAFILHCIFLVVVMFPTIAVSIRRVQDTNHCWWTALIPLYNIYLYLIAGDEGTNEYGDNPLI